MNIYDDINRENVLNTLKKFNLINNNKYFKTIF